MKAMLTVQQAHEAILREVHPFEPSVIKLDDALGLVLAEDIVSDVDSPRFDKALMDGVAVRSADLRSGQKALKIVEQVTAGRVPTRAVKTGEATQIMTGAPLPEGADCVVPVEQAEFNSDGGVSLSAVGVRPGTNVMPRGTALKVGDRVLAAGRVLEPQHLGALAELGRHEIRARRRPRVAVLATGDELVPVSTVPGPGQIRNSNESMLTAQIRRTGGEPLPLGIARDNETELRQRVEAGLHCDVLLLSGGVSAGKRDLVPLALEAAGVRQVFHKVHVKPGKPVWFGVRDADSANTDEKRPSRCYVFGLPGNPVSSMVCFELFARTAIRRLMGVEAARPVALRARLACKHEARGDRPTYHPACMRIDDDGPLVRPLVWHGSSDLQSTVNANAMAVFPAGDYSYAAGDFVDVVEWK